MATITVRNIDDTAYENLNKIAHANNRSTAAQIRKMIDDLSTVRMSPEDAIASLMAFRAKANWTLPAGTDSLSLLREERDSW
jgi:plasmid stability protein